MQKQKIKTFQWHREGNNPKECATAPVPCLCALHAGSDMTPEDPTVLRGGQVSEGVWAAYNTMERLCKWSQVWGNVTPIFTWLSESGQSIKHCKPPSSLAVPSVKTVLSSSLWANPSFLFNQRLFCHFYFDPPCLNSWLWSSSSSSLLGILLNNSTPATLSAGISRTCLRATWSCIDNLDHYSESATDFHFIDYLILLKFRLQALSLQSYHQARTFRCVLGSLNFFLTQTPKSLPGSPCKMRPTAGSSWRFRSTYLRSSRIQKFNIQR